MIKLVNLDKYFNKGKQNEIHVINRTSLVFPDNGFVTILGASGSGKTTLLNVIGGLDKATSGEIHYDSVVMKKYSMKKMDKIRQESIGYIFQNYYLLKDETVYDNLKIALNLCGIYDEKEIDSRIEYCLKAVGMYEYRRRKAINLSGGQQQRVSIARALVKKAKIIIADEPTGNLDGNNTIEIMNILKIISQTCLVIMVTHNQSIAEFYSDRIISMKDGTILSYKKNEKNEGMDLQDLGHVYLKDLEKKSIGMNDLSDVSLDLYYEQKDEVIEDFKVRAVLRNGTIYFDVISNHKIKYLGESNDLEFIDSTKKDNVRKNTYLEHYDNSFFNDKKKNSNKFGEWKRLFIDSIRNFFLVKLGKKFMYFGFFLMGFIFCIILAGYGNKTRKTVSTSLVFDTRMVELHNPKNNPYSLEELKEYGSVLSEAYFIKNTAYLSNDCFYEYIKTIKSCSIGFVDASFYTDSNLIYGNFPTKNNEVVLDDLVAQQFLDHIQFDKKEDLLNHTVVISELSYKIVGIMKTNAYTVAFSHESYLVHALNSFHTEYKFTTGDTYNIDVSHKNGIYLSSNLYEGQTNYTFYNQSYPVLGSFDGVEDIIVGENVLEDLCTTFKEKNKVDTFVISSSKKNTIQVLSSKYQITGIDLQDKLNNNTTLGLGLNTGTWFLIVLAISFFVYLYFMMRARMIQSIYTIGVYRALGAKPGRIYKIFLSDLFVITTFTTVFGYLLAYGIILYTNHLVGKVLSLFYFPWYFVIFGIIILYIANFLFGLLPIFLLLRKTPSEILSKYDI